MSRTGTTYNILTFAYYIVRWTSVWLDQNRTLPILVEIGGVLAGLLAVACLVSWFMCLCLLCGVRLPAASRPIH